MASLYLKRSLDLSKLTKRKSIFLFGPRATGKTSLIEHQLPKCKIYDLLDSSTYQRLLKRPSLLEEENQENNLTIVIDEIQKLPSLLDEVHRLISKKKKTFLLTGSSARKFKHGAANLLAGRAWQANLFPLTSNEIPNFNLLRYLNRGGLPDVYLGQYPEEDLQSYVSLYLQEEIQAEALTRNLPSFASFLDAIALSNGEEINFENLASDCGVSSKTIKNYIQILNDTLIGFSLPGFTQTKKRKAISRIKHYLFDIGVVNQLCQRGKIKPKSELFGKAFEHFILQETRAYLSYARLKIPMTYWRSTSQFEVDLILGKKIAIEIKATNLVSEKHLKGLRAFKEEGIIEKFIVVSNDQEARKTKDQINILPWAVFLKKLWQGNLI